jgi:uncharacterized protein (TIGR00159 family)
MILTIISQLIDVRVLDIIDIILVAVLLYQLYKLMKGTVAIPIFVGILAIYFLWKLVVALEMELLGEILGQFVSVGVIALIVVFQNEIRQFLLMVGRPKFISKKSRWFFFWKIPVNPANILNINTVVDACASMSEKYTGAIIVLSKQNELTEFINTGEVIDSNVSEQLISNIFFKNSPLHDGAIIIKTNRIIAARCVLPLTRNDNFPVTYGLRHRAAVGLTERSDAIAVIVSEQTGQIAFSKGGELITDVKPFDLKNFLEKEFKANYF